MWSELSEDLRRYYESSERSAKWRKLLHVATSYGAVATTVFRFGKWAQRLPRPLRQLGTSAYFVAYKLVEMSTGIRIASASEIGAGLCIHNFGGVIIHGRLGRRCTVVQGAQLLSRADNRNGGWPVLGDDVFVGAGAKILGPVRIGDGARIGANAVVIDSVPAGATAVGVPARVILENGSDLRRHAVAGGAGEGWAGARPRAIAVSDLSCEDPVEREEEL